MLGTIIAYDRKARRGTILAEGTSYLFRDEDGQGGPPVVGTTVEFDAARGAERPTVSRWRPAVRVADSPTYRLVCREDQPRVLWVGYDLEEVRDVRTFESPGRSVYFEEHSLRDQRWAPCLDPRPFWWR